MHDKGIEGCQWVDRREAILLPSSPPAHTHTNTEDIWTDKGTQDKAQTAFHAQMPADTRKRDGERAQGQGTKDKEEGLGGEESDKCM